MKLAPLILLAATFQVSAQTAASRHVPFFTSRSPEKLAHFLTDDLHSETDKAYALYFWITHNISYDVKNTNRPQVKLYTPRQTLRKRKALCGGYSALYDLLASISGLSSLTVYGYSKMIDLDPLYQGNHTWNAVKTETSWLFLDPTWGSGGYRYKKPRARALLFRWFKIPYTCTKRRFVSMPNDQNFNIAPEELQKNRLPVNPHWQLVTYPISLATFKSNDWTGTAIREDSVFQKTWTNADNESTLSYYTRLSPNQYQTINAKEAYAFNPKNTRLLSFAAYNNADLYNPASDTSAALLKAAASYGARHIQSIQKGTSQAMQSFNLRSKTEITSPTQRIAKKTATMERSLASRIATYDTRKQQISKKINLIEKIRRRPLDEITTRPVRTDTMLIGKNRRQSVIHHDAIHDLLLSNDLLSDSLNRMVIKQFEYADSILAEATSYQLSLLPLLSVFINNSPFEEVIQAMNGSRVLAEKLQSHLEAYEYLYKTGNQLQSELETSDNSLIRLANKLHVITLQNYQYSEGTLKDTTTYVYSWKLTQQACNHQIKLLHHAASRLDKENVFNKALHPILEEQTEQLSILIKTQARYLNGKRANLNMKKIQDQNEMNTLLEKIRKAQKKAM